MRRALSFTLLLAGCASDPPPLAQPPFTPDAVYAPPQVYAPPASVTPSAGAYPPSGIYSVVEHDACNRAHALPSHVTVLTTTRDGHPVGSVPITGTKRLEVTWDGFKAGPGELRDVTNTGFVLATIIEDCASEAEYRLETLVCDSRCNGSVPGMRAADAPPGPAQIQCVCF